MRVNKSISNHKITFLVVAFGLCALRAIYNYIHRKINKYPPGPNGIPFFGSLFSLIDLPKYVAYLASKYGSISMIYVGFQPFIFLHSIKLINEVFKHKNALDREWDGSLLLKHIKPAEQNTVVASEKYWPKKRKIFQSVMVSRLDSNFLNKVHNKSLNLHVFESINSCVAQNKLWYPYNDLHYIFFHAIWNALYGTYMNYHSKHKEQISSAMDAMANDAAIDVSIRYLGLQNVLKLLPSAFMKRNPLQGNMVRYENYLEKLLYEQLKYDETIFDFKNKKWDKHFQQIENDKDSCAASKFIAVHRNNPSDGGTKTAIIQEMTVLFSAGVDTCLNTSEYGMILLAKYDTIQEKIYNELIMQFGDKYNNWKMDKIEIKKVIHKLNYLRAFVYEVLRLSSAVPIGVAHCNSKSSIFVQNGKYKIPKHSVIISDIPSANRRDPYWHKQTNGNPMNVCLNLWLDKHDHFKYNLNKDKMVSFGVGPRNCGGMSMALRSLYLLFAKLILNYKFSLDSIEKDKHTEIKQKYQFVWIVQPKIGLRVQKRN